MWGVTKTLGRAVIGCPAGIGSGSNTSSPAPAIQPSRSARPRVIQSQAQRTVHLPEGATSLPVYSGADLRPGNFFEGPALVVRADTTILAERGDHCRVDRFGNLWLEMPAPPEAGF